MKLLRRLSPLLIAALLLALPTQAYAALVCHKITHDNVASSSCDTTATGATGANATLIVLLDAAQSFDGTPTDSAGNTYVQKTAWTCSNRTLTFYYKLAPATSTTHTWNPNCTACSNSLTVLVFDDAGPTFDQEVGNQSSCGGATNSPGSINPASATNLLVAGIGDDFDLPLTISPSGTGTTGFAITDSLGTGGPKSIGSAWYKQTTQTTQTPTWSETPASAQQIISAMLSFSLSSGSPPATCTSTLSTFGVSQCGEERR